jgi:hypothetical protein
MWWFISFLIDIHLNFSGEEAYSIFNPNFSVRVALDLIVLIAGVYIIYLHRTSPALKVRFILSLFALFLDCLFAVILQVYFILKEYEEEYIRKVMQNTVPLWRLIKVAATDVFLFSVGLLFGMTNRFAHFKS